MAKPSNGRALSLFAKTISVKTEDGVVSVPISAAENRMLNCVLVSQARQMVHEQMKLVRNLGQPLQPKELKDLIAAARDLVEASGEAYKGLDDDMENGQGEKQAEKVDAIEVDFTKMTQESKPEESKPNDQP